MHYEKFEKVRKEQYPMTEQFAYLDTSTSGMVSRRAKDAMTAYLEERFEELMENYNRADDEPKAEVRSMILEAVSERMDFMKTAAGCENLPDEKTMQSIAEIAHQLEHILGALNSPKFTPDDTELRRLADRAEELIDEQDELMTKFLKQ